MGIKTPPSPAGSYFDGGFDYRTMTAGTETDRLTARLPFKKCALVGACAYLLGYLVTYAVTIGFVQAELAKRQIDAKLSFFGIGGIQPWKITGWFYYRAHFVDVSTKGDMSIPLNSFIIEFSADDPHVWLFALPPLLLLAAGVLAARLTGAERLTVAAAAGFTVVPGYFALAFVGAFLTQINVIFAVAGPEITTALAAGFVYPVVFGPLGGVLAASVHRSRASSSPHGSNP